ncbi:hypothetical protein J3E68DRAFT_178365 [Trichoderma sp. SZMC 28012]
MRNTFLAELCLHCCFHFCSLFFIWKTPVWNFVLLLFSLRAATVVRIVELQLQLAPSYDFVPPNAPSPTEHLKSATSPIPRCPGIAVPATPRMLNRQQYKIQSFVSRQGRAVETIGGTRQAKTHTKPQLGCEVQASVFTSRVLYNFLLASCDSSPSPPRNSLGNHRERSRWIMD